MRSQISDDITFRKLEILLAYMEGGNLNAAARMLDISAVSVHRALHSLEDGMSCQLFSLQGRNLIPNDAAQVLADVSRDVVRLMADGIAATRSAAGYSADHLKIGSLYSLTTGTIPDVIIGIKLRKQELETELVLGSNADLLHKLKQNAIDAALMAVPEPDPDIESIALFEDDIFSLMNLVGAGIGYTLLPGRVRHAFGDKVQLIPLKNDYLMRQTIGLSFLRVRERDPNLLALAAVCRMLKHRTPAG
jgi:LysR family malonate utilization transcriptional regulator